jgi:hypothetical protein
LDVDVAQYLNGAFNGSAIITSSPHGVVVAVDVVNPSATRDSVDSYAGIPVGATDAFVMGAKAGSYLTFDTVIRIQNPTVNTAHVTVSFEASPANPIAVTIPPHGSAQPIDIGLLGDLKNGYVGAAHIQSDQPIVALSETTGAGPSATGTPTVTQSYGTAPMYTSVSASTRYVPRFVDESPPGWSTALILQNSGADTTFSTTFTMNFFDRNGNLVGTLPVSLTGGRSAIIGGLAGNLPQGVANSGLMARFWSRQALRAAVGR